METHIFSQTSSNLQNINLPSTQPQNEVEGGLFLNVVVGKSATVFQLLPSEDQPLLVRGNPLLILEFNNYIREQAVK